MPQQLTKRNDVLSASKGRLKVAARRPANRKSGARARLRRMESKQR